MLLAVDLLGFSDLVTMFGVSRTRTEQLIRDQAFPETHYVGAKRTRVWERDAVLTWAKEKKRPTYGLDSDSTEGMDAADQAPEES